MLLILKYWRAGVAVILVAAVVGYVATLQRQIGALTDALNVQKTENAQMRQAMQKLADAVATLPVGKSTIVYVDRPFMVQVPGQTITREVPVVVTRTEKTLETKVETLTLPGKEIERIVLEAPQSILATMTALRPIAQGEKFSATFVQLQPGIWQPLVTPDSPVGIEAKTVTPVDRIPAPIPVPSRWAWRIYTGYGSADQWLVGVRGVYFLTKRLDLEAQAECRQFTVSPLACGSQDYRVTAGFRF